MCGEDAFQENGAGRARVGMRQGPTTQMKTITVAGIALVVLGVVALIYQGFTYTTRETVIDLGPIHATAERERTVPLSPVLGIIAVGAGVGLILAGSRKRG
jgi:hypothetical protein